MLKIDDKEYEVTIQNIKICNFIDNFDKGYDIDIQIKFGKKGFLNLSAGFEKDNNINNFINKEYIGNPYQVEDSQINFFEIFDDTKFLDTEIVNKIKLKIGNIVDNKIEASIELDDDLIKIRYYGNLDIIN